jgi:nodulation protein E
MNRVVMTGAGTVNPLAPDVAGSLAALAAGRCAIGPLDMADLARLSIRIGAPVPDWRGEDHFTPSALSLMDRYAQFAVVAARQALASAGLVPQGALADQIGVIIGTAGGGLTSLDDSYRAVYEAGRSRVHPFTVPRLMHNAAASHIAMDLCLRGPGFSLSSACASSNHAMGLAFQMVRGGLAPAMLCGGAEAMLTFGGIKAWEGLRVLSPDGCRPFSANRNGMVMGEGAAVFVFENRDHARARGAPILAEVCGFGMTMDAHDLVQPSLDGPVRAMQAALADAGRVPSDIGYVNAHGTGTVVNDRVESAAIRQVFGGHADRLLVSSTKSMHGHLIGATSAVEMLACVMALRDGVIAPTIGHAAGDADCTLDVVPNVFRRAEVDHVMTNAFAFGGMNACLVLGRGA